MMINQREAAKAARDEGMQRAIDHADCLCDTWSLRAFNWVHGYAQWHAEFMSEDVRMAAEKAPGFVAPPDNRAWGAVMIKAARAGLIERTGYAQAKNPRVHCSVNAVWHSKVFKG